MAREFKRHERFEGKGSVLPINGVKVKWAALQSPDTRYEHCWKVNLILSKEQAEKMMAVGFNVSQDKDGDYFLVAKKKCRTKEGKLQTAPLVVGRDGRTPFTEELGNGSTVNAQVFSKYVEVKGETWLTAYLNSVQVLEHVPYSGSGFEDADAGTTTTGVDF